MAEMVCEGRIIKGIAGFYYVHTESMGVVECKAKGLFRNRKIKPLPGDMVRLSLLSVSGQTAGGTEGSFPQGNLTDVLPRKNELIRPPVANIDQVLVVFAVKEPDPHLNLLDRFLVIMEKKNIPVIIIFNKTDLTEKKDTLLLRQIYEKAHYTTLGIQANCDADRERVHELIFGKTTVLAGPSGVGKSTLMNLIQPEALMETGELSEKIKRGKNTTRHTELIYVSPGTFLIDTPGFSSLYIDEVEAGELSAYYPEIKEHEGNCRFAGCAHIKEPDCGVKEALSKGLISKERYENYCRLYEEAAKRKRYN